MHIDNFDITKKVFVIAEMSANHGHDINIAKETIKAAKEAGADAIKLQTYTADTITIDCNNEYFQVKQGTIWDGRTLYDLYREAYTPWEWHEELMDYAKELGLICFSSPFDKAAVDLLESLNVPAYKIASFEITDIPLIEYVASKRKPVIISTGIATIGEIDEAVQACRRVGNEQIILLKCTSAYPAKIEDANLLTMKNLKETFNVEVGLSDHTLGVTVPIVSVALGAKVIEKHFILDKNIGGPDASFSLDKQEFKMLVDTIRDAEKSIGCVDYEITDKKLKSREFSRSLFVVKDVKKGDIITTENVKSIRPGFGLKPKHLKSVLGKKVGQDIAKGTPLSWSFIE
ncbi:N-acetylneuraminic acid synthase [Paraliobacillus quinghaiensis]|uniref:N-acetylneuraminic acid synthase n=1 Tax=Paraliobacillus quinghaiensis TaxID=470815 RepID=A0A917TPF5_9BACI|nr:pseudaminic acid synthase [Paraliobacillus quinghaiensis]GGM31914.1 N-acetylneuraminic acid synthase [Paraliobacillus quinghaiensis]